MGVGVQDGLSSLNHCLGCSVFYGDISRADVGHCHDLMVSAALFSNLEHFLILGFLVLFPHSVIFRDYSMIPSVTS